MMSEKAKLELKPLLTGKFLNTLVMAMRVCGWEGGDALENAKFVRWCFYVAGKEGPEDLNPLDATEPLIGWPYTRSA